MGFFDKLIGKFKKSAKKTKVRLIMGSQKTDGQEQFLKQDDSMIITVGADEEKPHNEPKKSTGRKSEVVKVPVERPEPKKAEAPKRTTVKVAEKKQAKPAEAKAEEEPKIKVKVVKAEKPDDDDSYTKEAVTVTEGKSTRSGKFDIQRAKDGRFFFNLYASNHTVIAYSQIYSSTSAAMNGINSIIANASKSPIEDTTLKNPTSYPCPKWEIYIDKAGEYRFRLYASNGLCVCHAAHGYSTKSGCKGGIDSIGRFASDAAKINKSYLK